MAPQWVVVVVLVVLLPPLSGMVTIGESLNRLEERSLQQAIGRLENSKGTVNYNYLAVRCLEL